MLELMMTGVDYGEFPIDQRYCTNFLPFLDPNNNNAWNFLLIHISLMGISPRKTVPFGTSPIARPTRRIHLNFTLSQAQDIRQNGTRGRVRACAG